FIIFITGASCDPDKRVTVSTHQQVSPVLVGKSANPVLRIAVEIDSTGQSVRSLSVNTKGTTELDDIKEAALFYSGTDSTFNTDQPFGQPQQPEQSLRFSGEQSLQPGTNYFWVSYTLNSGINLLNGVDAGLDALKLSGGVEIVPVNGSPSGAKKVGIALRRRGEDDVHTSRIPGLVTTNKGTLIAAYDIRYESSADLQGDIDVGI